MPTVPFSTAPVVTPRYAPYTQAMNAYLRFHHAAASGRRGDRIFLDNNSLCNAPRKLSPVVTAHPTVLPRAAGPSVRNSASDPTKRRLELVGRIARSGWFKRNSNLPQTRMPRC